MAKKTDHWANNVERTSVLGIRLLFNLYRVLGRLPFCFALAPVVFCLWATDSRARGASLDYLKRARLAGYLSEDPNSFLTLKHMYRFAETILDKMLAAWDKNYSENLVIENESVMTELIAQKKGAVVLTSHMGCVEALMHHGSISGLPIIALVHSANTARFTNMVHQAEALKNIEFMEVTELNPASIMTLEEKCAQGYFIFIAGDRIPIQSDSVVSVPFLKSPAIFPTGGAILAHILKLPLISMTCWREASPRLYETKKTNRYHVRFAMIADAVRLPRKERQNALTNLMGAYVRELERGLAESPLDWFNFYRFWQK